MLSGRHLGKDSIAIIVFSCALTAEEYSNKPVQENIDKRLGWDKIIQKDFTAKKYSNEPVQENIDRRLGWDEIIQKDLEL